MLPSVKKIVIKICDVIIWMFILLIIYILSSVFCFSTFKIPSGSMTPEIESGDNILVFKPTVGARLFNIFKALDGEQVRIERIPGFRKIRRNDVIIFNNPYPHERNKIGMHILKYFAKRCVALPGDTFKIINGYYYVTNSRDKSLTPNLNVGYIEGQRAISEWKAEDIPSKILVDFYSDSTEIWNIKNFGPYYIPEKGAIVKMNRKNYQLYHKLIEWETGSHLEMHDNSVILNNNAITEYQFRKNYYFAAGDYAKDSQDSRYWGVLPEEYIVGVPWIVWYSEDKRTGKIRWSRILKRIR